VFGKDSGVGGKMEDSDAGGWTSLRTKKFVRGGKM
jgi:hypothetical protein